MVAAQDAHSIFPIISQIIYSLSLCPNLSSLNSNLLTLLLIYLKKNS